MDIVNDFIMQAIASPWLYAVMFIVAVIDGFFPPIPSETVLVAAAAVAASTGGTNLLLLCAIAAIGAAIGDNIAFSIGRGVGIHRFRWMRRPRVATSFDWASRALDRSGAGLILGARYIPVGRVAVNMTAGALGYSRRKFMPLSVIAGTMWAAYSTGIGLIAGNIVKDNPLLGALIGIVLALVIGFVIDRLVTFRRRRRERADLSAELDAARASERIPTDAA
ncbi:DedA family protein [Paramicrobacterium agarici]|uniref:DedA family protein n=1 Tax=Paramicrobacterium agarici TaxID=630514 RepID=UPI001150FE8E|nr:VTT domain-containing protein [Microbacterium agarici]